MVESLVEPLVADRWDLSTRVQEPSGELLTLHPGRIVELSGFAGAGLTRLGYRMLAEQSKSSSVVVLDVRGWMSPLAAWEAGVDRERLIVVRCPEPRIWPQVAAALCEGVKAMVAEVPSGVRETDLRRLAALIRARQVRVALRPVRGELPSGISHLRVRAVSIGWSGYERGHGRLTERRMVVEISGKGAAGITRRIEVEDAGADIVRVVSGVVARTAGRAV
jgi:primosomal replication protein N